MNLIKSCCLFVVFSSFLACTSQVSDVKSVSYTEFVNPFIGTDFTGNTYPGAQAPFGMVQLSPDNGLPGWDRISGYFYPDKPASQDRYANGREQYKDIHSGVGPGA